MRGWIFTTREIFILIVLSLFLIFSIFLALSLGSVNIAFKDLYLLIMKKLSLLSSGAIKNEINEDILWKLRLPRILLACIAGFALAEVGAVFQAILRNPLAEPYILGISGGAEFGVIIGFLFLDRDGFYNPEFISLFGFAGCLVSIFIIYHLALRGKTLSVQHLLLVGVMLNAFFSSLIMFFYSFIPALQLKGIIFWLMGDLSGFQPHILLLFGVVFISSMVFFSLYQKLNLFVLGDETASSMGVNPESLKKLVFLLSSFLIGSIVAYTGLIGFVGLIVPHILRLIVGANHRLLLPASGIAGATFLIISDTIARVILPSSEIPVGVITAMTGAPFFIFLLIRNMRKSLI